jgi:hypothetical protein
LCASCAAAILPDLRPVDKVSESTEASCQIESILQAPVGSRLLRRGFGRPAELVRGLGSTAPLCSSGTFVDQFIGGGGAFRSGHVEYGSATVLKTFTCADNSGTFRILFHPQFSPATAADCAQAGPFAVGGGTGAYTKLRGHGDFCLLVEGDEATETFTGTFTLG